MRQAIVTKYLGPTDYRGSRVKATAQAGSMTVPWDHALDPAENHRAAAFALAKRLGWARDPSWRTDWHGGALPNDTGYAFVCAEDK